MVTLMIASVVGVVSLFVVFIDLKTHLDEVENEIKSSEYIFKLSKLFLEFL